MQLYMCFAVLIFIISPLPRNYSIILLSLSRKLVYIELTFRINKIFIGKCGACAGTSHYRQM